MVENNQLLHVVSSLSLEAGGIAQSLRTLVPALEKLGVRSTIVTCDTQKFNVGSSNVYAFGFKNKTWAYSPDLNSWLVDSLSRFKTVILHGLWQYPVYAATRQIRRLRRVAKQSPKVFVMPHGMLDPWFQLDKSRRLKAYRNWMYWKLIERHTINHADCLLFTSEKERALARQTFGPYQPKRESVISLGVDAPSAFESSMKMAFQTVCPGIKEKPFFLYLSRIDYKKGVDQLIDAYAHVASQDRYQKAGLMPLVIAGPDSSVFARAMKQRAKRLNLLKDCSVDAQGKAAIYFPGMLREHAKWGAFFGCDAFILPSHQESFGIATVEALACSKSVLISSKIDIAEDIDSDGAAIVEPDTLMGTIRLFQRWLDLPIDRRSEMDKNAVKCYLNRYRPSVAAEALVNLLNVGQ